MPNKLRLSALDGYVLIDGDTVSVMSNEDVVIQISTEVWKTLRESLCLDDTVDYGRGETPMTGYQLCKFVELTREVKRLEAEKEKLNSSV